MSEFYPSYEHEDESSTSEAIAFNFGIKNALEAEVAQEIYLDGPVAKWAEERRRRWGEFIEPRKMYVSGEDGGQLHRVVWVQHLGLFEDSSEIHSPYSIYHVVCDCAEAGDDSSAQPTYIFGCPELRAVLKQRAEEISQKFSMPEATMGVNIFDDKKGQFELVSMGQDMDLCSVAYLLETDFKHPEEWVANRVSGWHDVGTLSYILDKTPQELMPTLEKMQKQHIIDCDGQVVKFSEAQKGLMAYGFE